MLIVGYYHLCHIEDWVWCEKKLFYNLLPKIIPGHGHGHYRGHGHRHDHGHGHGSMVVAMLVVSAVLGGRGCGGGVALVCGSDTK